MIGAGVVAVRVDPGMLIMPSLVIVLLVFLTILDVRCFRFATTIPRY